MLFITRRFQKFYSKIRLRKRLIHLDHVMATNPSYEETVATLNTLQSNAATLAAKRLKRLEKPDENLILTQECLIRSGLQVKDLVPLNVIHVAGTKGKGSVCALTESILRHSGFKTGFFSSPHLVHVRERIRINGKSISKEDFVRYFWPIYNKLIETKTNSNSYMPPYFKFLTLMAFHIFLIEKVDVAVIEVGIGGAYDCTNIISNPVVCAVTTLDFDHTDILGDTIESIAWQKSGIFKEGSLAICASQSISAMKILYQRANELKCPLYSAPSLDSYKNGVKIGIPGLPQLENASLALQLARIWQKRMISKSALPECTNEILEDPVTYEKLAVSIAEPFKMLPAEIEGLESCRWPGRCQRISHSNITYFLDGAHTLKSMEYCAQWFNENSSDNNVSVNGVFKILVFNCTSGRDSANLLKPLLDCDFDAAIFCTNIVENEKNPTADLTNLMIEQNSVLSKCDQNKQIWLNLSTKNNFNDKKYQFFNKNNNFKINDMEKFVIIKPDVSSALKWIEEKSIKDFPNLHIDVLIAGSLHLVGAILSILKPDLSLEN